MSNERALSTVTSHQTTKDMLKTDDHGNTEIIPRVTKIDQKLRDAVVEVDLAIIAVTARYRSIQAVPVHVEVAEVVGPRNDDDTLRSENERNARSTGDTVIGPQEVFHQGRIFELELSATMTTMMP